MDGRKAGSEMKEMIMEYIDEKRGEKGAVSGSRTLIMRKIDRDWIVYRFQRLRLSVINMPLLIIVQFLQKLIRE